MVKIATCQKCGSRMTEMWKEHSNCVDCGGPVDKIDIDMGFSERAPRILMVGGLAFCIFAALFLVYKMIFDDVGQDAGVTTMVMFFIGIGFFASSLVLRLLISKKAMDKAPSNGTDRKQRRVRGSPGKNGGTVRVGKVDTPMKRTATKLPVNRK